MSQSKLLYGAVEWIKGRPILDGMKCFSTKVEAIDYANDQANMTRQLGHDEMYTIIRIERVVELRGSSKE